VKNFPLIELGEIPVFRRPTLFRSYRSPSSSTAHPQGGRKRTAGRSGSSPTNGGDSLSFHTLTHSLFCLLLRRLATSPDTFTCSPCSVWSAPHLLAGSTNDREHASPNLPAARSPPTNLRKRLPSASLRSPFFFLPPGFTPDESYRRTKPSSFT